jgi:hypothetical protein
LSTKVARIQVKRSLSYKVPRACPWVSTLKYFIRNFKADKDLSAGFLLIPKWKFRVLMGTDEQKAKSLLEQWLNKGYLRKTEKKGEYGEGIYEINPYLEEKLKQVEDIKIPQKWITGFEELNADKLNEYGYFEIRKNIQKVRIKDRRLLLRDFDELFINYFLMNEKAIVVISGSIAELLLVYYCEKKHVPAISYEINGQKFNRKLYDADLSDFLRYFEQNKLLGDSTINLGNLSRIYRNYVHPGKELRETKELDQNKAEICFRNTLEMIKSICK